MQKLRDLRKSIVTWTRSSRACPWISTSTSCKLKRLKKRKLGRSRTQILLLESQLIPDLNA